MDGISAASSIVQVLGAALVLSQKLATFIIDVREVVETRSRLFDQVKSLYEVVIAVHTVLKRRKDTGRPVGEDEKGVYEQTERTLMKTRRCVEWLEELLIKLGGGGLGGNGKWVQKAWLQVKVQVRNPAIGKLERQFETSVSSLQLMLQCINVFMHEETQSLVQNGFDTTNAHIVQIHAMMVELRALVQHPLLGGQINALKLEEKDSAVDLEPGLSFEFDDMEDQASDIASECLSVAESLCGKISRPSTVIKFPWQTSSDSNEIPGEPLSRPGNLSRGTTSSVPTRTPSPKTKAPRPRAVEPSDILTDHIDNAYNMAVTGLSEKRYSAAQDHIIRAIETAKKREEFYNFPFENEMAYREIIAFTKAKNAEYEEAKHEYENLLRDAEASPCSKDTQGRLYYALAQVYHDEYCERHMGQKDDRLFEDWENCGLHAYHSAHEVPGRPHSTSLWKTHPSLSQTGQSMAQLYNYWGKPDMAKTYLERHPSISDPAPRPTPTPVFVPVIGNVLPTPPPSDDQLERAHSRSTDPSFEASLKGLHKSSSSASGLLILQKVEQNDYESTKWILDVAGGSVDMEKRNPGGLTPLLVAVQNRHTKLVRLLLEHEKSPDVKARAKNGWTVLHYALSGFEGEDMVELLVRKGADVNAAANDGTTPLHCAVQNHKVHGAGILLKAGALTEIRDIANRTPMYMAVKMKRTEMFGLLIGAGAVFDRSAYNKPEMIKFIEDCEDTSILEATTPEKAPAPRRESVLSVSRKSLFKRRSRGSVGS